MQIQLIPNWDKVLKRAWSLKLIAIAGLFSGIEAALAILPPEWTIWMPAGFWPALTMAVTAAAFGARLVAQDSLKNEEQK